MLLTVHNAASHFAPVMSRPSKRTRPSDASWASEDISVLHELLHTPRSTDEVSEEEQKTAFELAWRQSFEWGDDDNTRDVDVNSDNQPKNSDSQRSETDSGEDEGLDAEADARHELVVTALRRQLQLLQQEYDRHLEQHVARSVAAAGGRSAPKAATIRLYRQYERLARVAASLEAENARLVLLLQDRERQLQELRVQKQQEEKTTQASGVLGQQQANEIDEESKETEMHLSKLSPGE